MARKRKQQFFENIEIIDAGAKGKAVAKAPDGKVIFVDGAAPGDWVSIETRKKRKAYYEGVVTEIHKEASIRVKPECQHFEYCGGCKWQHMDYDAQLHYKQKEVLQNFKKFSQLEDVDTKPIVGCEKKYFYRNKMEFSFSSNRWLTPEEINSQTEVSNRNALGFHIAGMWDKILDIEKCHLQEDPSNAIRNFIKHFALENDISFYNPKTQSGELRTLMIRIVSTKELMVVIQFFEDNKNNREALLKAIREKFNPTSLQYIINQKANDSIYDQEVICYDGRDFIEEEMEGLRFKINAKSFYQTNSEQAYKLYQVARDLADLKGNETVYDLYTGTGTIAQFVAKKCKKVVGIEAVPEAIADAKLNAQVNNIENASFFVGDMKDVFDDTFLETHGKPDLVITDPPRDGMHQKVVHQLLKIAPERIVYISCNSATQARDLYLMKEKYDLIESVAVDMFPQTHHIENVVLLKKK